MNSDDNSPPPNIHSTTPAKKHRKKSKNRVKYWSLPTVSSGTFDPRFLTERQQLQYLAQKTLSSAGDDTLEVSPLRLDRIKLEEKRMLELQQRNKHPEELRKTEEQLKRSLESSSPITPQKKSKVTIKSSPRQLASSPLAPSSSRPSRRSSQSLNNNLNNTKNALMASSLLKECFIDDSQRKVEEEMTKFDGQLMEEISSEVYELDSEPVLKEATFKTTDLTKSETTSTPSISDRVRGFLDYTRSVRQRHLNALLEAMQLRRGMTAEDVESKRRELEAKL